MSRFVHSTRERQGREQGWQQPRDSSHSTSPLQCGRELISHATTLAGHTGSCHLSPRFHHQIFPPQKSHRPSSILRESSVVGELNSRYYFKHYSSRSQRSICEYLEVASWIGGGFNGTPIRSQQTNYPLKPQTDDDGYKDDIS